MRTHLQLVAIKYVV